ncbi:hypothetical protein, partial [Pseudomonas lundensis]|uniref:hypothetical protein n=1 Tax=Pseudomonas lundensis TaxID=86185 RepID=UPI001CA41C5A
AGLLALASVLGVGEGHLLHRETRWVGSRYFAKSESLFQSFPKGKFTFTGDGPNINDGDFSVQFNKLT